MSKAWKNLEREVAKALNGTRRSRVNYGESIEDVAHPFFAIECKYGKCIPKKALEGKKCRFLDKAFAQAKSYNPGKQPIVCLKTPRMKGFVAIVGYPDKPLATHFPPYL